MFLLCFCLDYLDDLDLDYYKLFPFKINVPCSFKLDLLNGIHLELYLKVLSNSNCAHLSLTLFPNITFHWKLQWGFFFFFLENQFLNIFQQIPDQISRIKTPISL